MGNPRHLVLVGMMGCGKSTIGRQLARHSHRLFSDTDLMVETYHRQPVARIFAEEGETVFRDYEHEMVARALADPQPGIIATGGGAVIRADNRQLLWSRGWVVYLKAEPAQLLRRLRRDGSRPLLDGGNPLAVLEKLLAQRAEWYESAHHTVPIGDLPLRDVCRSLWRAYRDSGHSGLPPRTHA